MSNIVKREPFAINDLFDDLFKGFWVRPMRWPGEMAEMESIRMDVKEDEKAYTVHAEMPGVKKEDIHISIEGETVSISAEVKKTSEEKEGEKVLRSERYYGKVSRSFNLGKPIDEAAAEAKFADGVLELVLPKKAGAVAKELTVH
ncbi:MAG: Hsp20/alpha crystallin family protein [Pseudomonadota bacterium]